MYDLIQMIWTKLQYWQEINLLFYVSFCVLFGFFVFDDYPHVSGCTFKTTLSIAEEWS